MTQNTNPNASELSEIDRHHEHEPEWFITRFAVRSQQLSARDPIHFPPEDLE